ncbi:MAG: hypothetical protein LIO87_07700 [Eubacterium sp.]|nr:hypothetical protein [Eubacterium sp.]
MGFNTEKIGDDYKNDKNERQIFDKITEVIRKFYSNGIRFDDTVIRLLEQASSSSIDELTRNELKKNMFCRSDGLYFLTDVISNSKQSELLKKENLLYEISKYGCIDLRALFFKYNGLGKTACLRSEKDFEDYLMFLLPDEIRIGKALNTKIIRKKGVPVKKALDTAANKVILTIKENECITQEDLQTEFSFFSNEFLCRILEKNNDRVLRAEINDFLCYQTIESIGLGEGFSDVLDECLDMLDGLSLTPSQEVIHALLSIKLGYNFKDEYNISDYKTFRCIVSAYYKGNKRREWAAGSFLEVSSVNV